MNELSLKKKAEIIRILAEGNSLRACARISGTHYMTVLNLFKSVGKACQLFHEQTVLNIKAQFVQCDEIWSFVYAKDKNVPIRFKNQNGYGDIYTWIAMDAKTKLIITWLSGKRGTEEAKAFIKRLSEMLNNRFQLTTDGHKPYLEAVDESFQDLIYYAQNFKIYKAKRANRADSKFTGEHSFTAERCVASHKRVIHGKPNADYISTSHIERQNLTVRMSSRRFTRATNAFSKNFENHCYALALQFVYYNFCRIHKTLRVTPAMEAGLTDDIWTAEDIVKVAYKS